MDVHDACASDIKLHSLVLIKRQWCSVAWKITALTFLQG